MLLKLGFIQVCFIQSEVAWVGGITEHSRLKRWYRVVEVGRVPLGGSGSCIANGRDGALPC